MKLDVLESGSEPWYGEGLRFTCTQCGNCCTGGPGYVWISEEEIGRLAGFLKMSEMEVKKKYCRKIGGQISLKERRNGQGFYDCVFLKEIPAEKKEGEGIVQTRQGCSIYTVRPLQCRTWPFWAGNLSGQKIWDMAGKRCRGINQGKKWTREEMEALRDAKDWPEQAPGSGE